MVASIDVRRNAVTWRELLPARTATTQRMILRSSRRAAWAGTRAADAVASPVRSIPTPSRRSWRARYRAARIWAGAARTALSRLVPARGDRKRSSIRRSEMDTAMKDRGSIDTADNKRLARPYGACDEGFNRDVDNRLAAGLQGPVSYFDLQGSLATTPGDDSAAREGMERGVWRCESKFQLGL